MNIFYVACKNVSSSIGNIKLYLIYKPIYVNLFYVLF